MYSMNPTLSKPLCPHLELRCRGIEDPELGLPRKVEELGHDKVRGDQDGEVANLSEEWGDVNVGKAACMVGEGPLNR